MRTRVDNVVGIINANEERLLISTSCIHAVSSSHARGHRPRKTKILILARGSDDPLVAKTLLTAAVLFRKTYLGESFDDLKGLTLSLELLRRLSAMADKRDTMREVEHKAVIDYEERQPLSVGATARWASFVSKTLEALDVLRKIVILFHPTAKKGWLDFLSLLAAKANAPNELNEAISDAINFLREVRELRRMHSDKGQPRRIRVLDFRVLETGEIILPTIEFLDHETRTSACAVTSMMSQLTDDIAHTAETLVAFLCSTRASQWAGGVLVSELPESRREYPLARMGYISKF